MEALIQIILGLGGALFAGTKSLKFVKEGELGVKLKFGRALPGEVTPGFVLLVPVMHELETIHVRITSQSVPPQKITLADGLTFTVSGVVEYRVVNPHQALFNIADVKDSVNNSAASILRSLVSDLNYKQASDFDGLSEQLLERIKADTEGWGLQFQRFGITDFAPTAEAAKALTEIAQVEKQIEGNEKLLTSLKENLPTITEIAAGNEAAILSALLLRGGVQATLPMPSSPSTTEVRVVRGGK